MIVGRMACDVRGIIVVLIVIALGEGNLDIFIEALLLMTTVMTVVSLVTLSLVEALKHWEDG